MSAAVRGQERVNRLVPGTLLAHTGRSWVQHVGVVERTQHVAVITSRQAGDERGCAR